MRGRVWIGRPQSVAELVQVEDALVEELVSHRGKRIVIHRVDHEHWSAQRLHRLSMGFGLGLGRSKAGLDIAMPQQRR
jgi:hypothetical protein